MTPFPTNPIDLNNLLISAVCKDGLRLGDNARRVVEISRQMNRKEAGTAQEAPRK